MKDRDFCCVDNFSVLVPYRDLQKLLEAAYSIERLQAQLDMNAKQLASLRGMYSEALEKIAEIERFL